MSGLRDVAARAGASLATVSYALRGDPRIAPQTAARIREAASALGWRPRPEVAADAAKRFDPARRSGIPIAYVVARREWGATAQRVLRCARTIGWDLRRIGASSADDPRRLRDRLLADGIRGVILDAGPGCAALVEADWSPLPVVLGWQSGPRGPHPAVREQDPFDAVRTAVARIVAAGHRRVGCIIPGNRPSLPADAMRHAAWLLARQEHGLEAVAEFRPRRTGEGDWPAELSAWVAAQRPSAVLGFSCAPWYELRKSHPGVSYAATLLDAEDAWSQPVAGCVIDPPVIAEALLSLLDQRLRGWNAPAGELFLATRWKDGVSLRPASARSAGGRGRPGRGRG